MSVEAWLAFCVTETVLCFTPGPAVLLVVSVATARGVRPALGATLGILGANTFYFALSAVGVGAALVASRELFLLIKWAGAAYLVWVGVSMLARSRTAEARSGPPGPASFVKGFVVQGANPKALVFFTALLPQFLDPSSPVGMQVLLLGASSVVIELAALTAYACTAARLRTLAGTRFAGALERVGGALLVGAGARLVVVRDA